MTPIPAGWERCDWRTPWPGGCQDGRAWRFGLRGPDLADFKTPHRWWQADARTAFVIHTIQDRPTDAAMMKVLKENRWPPVDWREWRESYGQRTPPHADDPAAS